MGSGTRLTWVIAATLVFAAGCATTSHDTDSASEQPSAAALVLGEWVMAPPPGQERDVALVRFALAEPPAVDAFTAMQPSSEESETFANILRLRAEAPGSPLLEDLQRKLDELDGVRLTVLPDKLIVSTASGVSITEYLVEEDLGDKLVILEEGSGSEESRRKILSFDGEDRMVITSGPTRIPMVRVAAGAVPPPNEVASAPSGVAASASSSEVPVSGNAEYDACVAEYFRCVDALPPAEREAMAEVVELTKQIFAEARSDPERMRYALESCTQAVELAHLTYCQ